MTDNETLDSYIRHRAKAADLNMSELCRRAKISRQTFYDLADVPRKLPTLQTVISLADVLEVHPLRLLHLVFDKVPIHPVAQHPIRSDRSAFVADVTFPDGALVLPRKKFTKVWEVQNVGKVAWENRFLQCVDEDLIVYARTGEVMNLANRLIPHATRIAVPPTQPGETVKIQVNFTAPATPGTVISYWKSVFEDGTFCFPKAIGLSCKVRVSTLASSATELRSL